MASIHIRHAAEGMKIDISLSSEDFERIRTTETGATFEVGRDLTARGAKDLAELNIILGP